MDEKQFKIICEKLNKITALLSIQNIEDINDKIYSLKKMGFSSEEIAPLVCVKNPRQMEGWKRK
jgi:hypothetical protein